MSDTMLPTTSASGWPPGCGFDLRHCERPMRWAGSYGADPTHVVRFVCPQCDTHATVTVDTPERRAE